MARSNRLLKRCYNETLDIIAAKQSFDSNSALANRLGVSRNTSRRVIESLEEQQFLDRSSAVWVFPKIPEPQHYYSEESVRETHELIEAAFMDKILNESLKTNSRFSAAALAKEIGVSTSAVREFLVGLSKLEFVRKEPQRSWILEGFTEAYAEELHEVREMFEVRAIEKLIVLPEEHLFWPNLHRMHREHLTFISNYEECYLKFPSLDSRFHKLLNEASNNRFINSFQDAITLIFHYHYRWNKSDEKERNLMAAQEHVKIIEALLLKDQERASAGLKEHLASAKITLKKSVKG